MRVVEMGKSPEKEITCKVCNSILAYTKADVTFYMEEMFGEIHTSESIKCPVCGNKIILSIDGESFNNIPKDK